MEEAATSKKRESLPLYLPKRSTVLVYCFILTVLLSGQYHLLDGVMEAVLRDEGNSLCCRV